MVEADEVDVAGVWGGKLKGKEDVLNSVELDSSGMGGGMACEMVAVLVTVDGRYGCSCLVVTA